MKIKKALSEKIQICLAPHVIFCSFPEASPLSLIFPNGTLEVSLGIIHEHGKIKKK